MSALPDAAPPRLLVVDDVADNRVILCRFFNRRGYVCVDVDSGMAALERLAAETFDVVLLDVMMPEMDGLEVLARIRETDARLPVIMVTAKAASEHVVEALTAGANDYITKPVDFAVAVARVETQLGRKRAEDSAAEAARAIGELNAALEGRIEARTHELVETNARLQAAMEEAQAVSATLREREAHITRMAFSDADTGLGNRRALQRSIEEALAAEGRPGVGVLCIERFSQVRNAIGAQLSHELVVAVARRLEELGCTGVARLTSSTLGFLFGAPDEAQAHGHLEALVHAMRRSFPVDGSVVDITTAVGFTLPTGDDAVPETLIERASIALDLAIQHRRRTAVFDPAAYDSPAQNLSLMSELLAGLNEPQFRLVYQPKYDLRRGGVHSVEALSRWQHPTRGVIPPDLFVNMAEETGHIREMTEWVLNQALADQTDLAARGHSLDVSVNLSGRLLADDDFMAAVLMHAARWNGHLCLEITETAVIDNPERGKRNIAALAAAGVRVSIDDYGSGLSSLAYLRDIQAQELKIDKSFILQLDSDPRSALLVRSTIDMAHALGLEVTAEGVETLASQEMLAGMQCDLAQGYFISKPLALPDLTVYLDSQAVGSAPVHRAAA